MRITIPSDIATKAHKYPYIAICKHDESIILFTKKNTGVCLDAGSNTDNIIGNKYSDFNESEHILVPKLIIEQ